MPPIPRVYVKRLLVLLVLLTVTFTLTYLALRWISAVYPWTVYPLALFSALTILYMMKGFLGRGGGEGDRLFKLALIAGLIYGIFLFPESFVMLMPLTLTTLILTRLVGFTAHTLRPRPARRYRISRRDLEELVKTLKKKAK